VSERESSGNVVSGSQIYGWQRRVREIDAEMESLSLEKKKLERLVQMAEMLESEAKLLAGVGGSQRDALDGIERTDTFVKAVLVIAGRFEDGATYDDIREAILKSPLGDKYRKSDKGFYTALAKLKHRGELVDRSGYVFTPANLDIYQRKVAAGLKLDKSRDPASEKRESPLYNLVLDAIARTPGLIAKDVIGRIRAESDQGKALTDNENSAYNAIARLKKRGVIEGYGRLERQLRIGPNAPEKYKRIASTGVVVHLAKRTEAPSGGAAGASEAGPLFGIAPQR